MHQGLNSIMDLAGDEFSAADSEINDVFCTSFSLLMLYIKVIVLNVYH